ncbi:MAG: lamin tail domain-containing protein [Thermoanaerobaculia bacterium]|nr:lamin tail domain-containing protein [Thermoanaerobaculia bacterium]
MKKLALSLIGALALTLAAQAQVVITEIMYNPPEGGTDTLEYIEIYNNSANTVDLENWSLFGVVFTFPAASLSPDQYMLIAGNAAAIQNQFGKTAFQWTGGALSNGGETLLLLNAAGDTIDRVTFDDVLPWPTEANANGASLVLCDPDSDNTLPASWQAATTPTGIIINGKEIFANPGAPSGCQTTVDAKPDQYIAPAGESSTFKVLLNDVLPGQASATVNIQTAPQNGIASVNPDNSITYTPTGGFAGADSLIYQVCENTDCDEAKVSLTVRKYPAYAISQINGVNADGVADSLNVYCQITATVYGVNLRPQGLQFTIIDDNNDGITVLNFTGNLGYTVKQKDKITVRGQINQFNGLLQIFPDAVIKVSENNPLLTPEDVTVHSEETESALIRIKNLRYVDPAQWLTGTGTGFSVFMVSDDHPFDTIQVRIDNDINLFNEAAPPAPFDLTGIGGQFDSSLPYTGGYQIAPRYKEDISTLVKTQTVDFSGQVHISPNPAGELLRIQTSLEFDRIQIFTTAGQLMQSLTTPGGQTLLPVRDFAPGVYFIHFQKDNSVWTTRFVKR